MGNVLGPGPLVLVFLLHSLRFIQLDRAIAFLVFLDRRRDMDAEALCRVGRHDDSVFELHRLVYDILEEVEVCAEVHDDFVRGLHDPHNLNLYA
jgi:hypothetical protein